MARPIISETVELLSGSNVFKQGDDITLSFQIRNHDKSIKDLEGATAYFLLADKDAVVLERDAEIAGDVINVNFTNADTQTGNGNMRLELHITENGETRKFPSDGFIGIRITPTLDDLQYGGVPYFTFEAFVEEYNQIVADTKEEMKADVVEIRGDLESRGINAMSPPAPFAPAKGDGTDDSTVINNLLQNFNYVYLPSNKTFNINDTIVVPDNKSLITLGEFSELKLIRKDIPAVEVGVNSKFSGVRILLASGNTVDSGCGIKIRLDAQSTRAYIDRVEVIGTDLTGNGIFVEGTSGSCAFTQINNVYFTRVKNAMKTNVTLPAYANGFIGNNWVVRSSQRAFYLVGSEGNNFTNVQWNTGAYSIEPIYCRSNFNDFHGFWWDLGVSTVPNQLATFEGTAEGNVIRSSDTINSWVINDLTDTKLNFINTMKDDVFKTIKEASFIPNVWMSSTEYKKWGYWFDSKPYGGVQDNILAYADKINVVTNTGKALSGGVLGNAFDPFAGISTGKPNWNLNTGEQAQIKIDLNNPVTPTKRLDFIQVVFSSTLEASGVKFELSADNGTTWTTVKEVTNNNKRYVVFQDNLTASQVSANPTNIRITLTNPLNASKDIRVEAINGRMLSVAGYTFMPRNGGEMYGSIKLEKGNFILNNETPASDVNNALFVESNELKFKNSSGEALYLGRKHKEDYGAEPPTTGKWNVMDRRNNTELFAGGYLGWVCVESGEFGTTKEPVFKPFGLISE